MSSVTLAETPPLGGASSWKMCASLAVQMSGDLPWRALAEVLDQAQDVVGRQRVRPAVGTGAWPAGPFAFPGRGTREDFAHKGRRTRPRRLHTSAGPVELILCQVAYGADAGWSP